jgi:hypothetical protein
MAIWIRTWEYRLHIIMRRELNGRLDKDTQIQVGMMITRFASMLPTYVYWKRTNGAHSCAQPEWSIPFCVFCRTHPRHID